MAPPARVWHPRIVDDVAYIPLTRGFEAVIDAVDLPLVTAFAWHAQLSYYSWYARCHIRGGGNAKAFMHNLILPPPQGLTIDHQDGDGLNNRRSNLRHATPGQQMWNRRKHRSSLSKHKGVSWASGRPGSRGSWRAIIVVNGRMIARFASTELEAALIYNDLAIQHFGPYASLNEVP